MPSFAVIDGTPVCGMKTITVFPANKAPLSAHQGSVMLFDGDDGRLKCAGPPYPILPEATVVGCSVRLRGYSVRLRGKRPITTLCVQSSRRALLEATSEATPPL